ncbi:lipocalin-like domain-containing protein [Albimonas pacifica]|uniref:Predicted secreted hydrolase n=1 Tax=Albimonas pacifica TaxID=1114924 RepID=A0A1I3HR44_9RHOB|nr:lipocalin-like domain-containing protein [Albimonas pacifica]SFI38122.1 Predicted secreted hydrolase [Albimonas pacifica]
MNADRLIRLLGAAALALALGLDAPVGAQGQAQAQGQGASGLSGMTGEGTSAGQGYAGLSGGGEGYAPVSPGRRFAFPADHGPHPGHRIEWWYVTANLAAPDGRAFGVQWTLFRQALSPDPASEGWSAPQVWLAHAAVTSAQAHRTAEKLGRGGVGQAGVRAEPFRAWLDDWRLESRGEGFSPLRLAAHGPGFAYDLTLAAEGPLVLQGENGFSLKSEGGQASYYYSHPFLAVTGALTLDGETVQVTGRAWLDREWSSQPLAGDQPGWDWFALHLPRGEKLMLYRLRRAGGGGYQASSFISADGAVEALSGPQVAMAPIETARVAGRDVPVRWRLSVPSRGLEVVTAPLNPQAWMGDSFPYWEGPISFAGTHDGVGYMELTGY